MADTQQLKTIELQQSKKRKAPDVGVEEEDKSSLLANGSSTNGKKAPIASSSATATGSKKSASRGHSTANASSSTSQPHHHETKDDSGVQDDYQPLSLVDIRSRLSELCERVPSVPQQGLDPKNPSEIKPLGGSIAGDFGRIQFAGLLRIDCHLQMGNRSVWSGRSTFGHAQW